MNEKALNEARQIIAGFLKKRREELGYSQAYVAERTGMSTRTIIRAEQAQFWLGMKQYLLLCEALHLFPSVSEIESSTPIARALRENWKPNQKDMSIEDALKLKASKHKRPGDHN